MKRYEKKLNELRVKRSDLLNKSSVVSANEEEIKERKHAENLLKNDPELANFDKIENVVEYQAKIDNNAAKLEEEIKDLEFEYERIDHEITEINENLQSAEEYIEQINKENEEVTNKSEELLKRFDELSRRDVELQKQIRETTDPNEQDRLRKEREAVRKEMDDVAEENRRDFELNNADYNKRISKNEKSKAFFEKNLNDAKTQVTELLGQSKEIENKLFKKIDQFNDLKNKSAKCDLVISNLLKGRNWDEIGVIAENFQNREFKSKDDIIAKRQNRIKIPEKLDSKLEDKVEERVQSRIKEYKDQFKKEPTEEQIKNWRNAAIEKLQNKDSKDTLDKKTIENIEKGLNAEADRIISESKEDKTEEKTEEKVEEKPAKKEQKRYELFATPRRPIKEVLPSEETKTEIKSNIKAEEAKAKAENETEQKPKWWQFIKRFKLWVKNRNVKAIPEGTEKVEEKAAEKVEEKVAEKVEEKVAEKVTPKRDEFIENLHIIYDKGVEKNREDILWDGKIENEILSMATSAIKGGKEFDYEEASQIAIDKYGVEARINAKVNKMMIKAEKEGKLKVNSKKDILKAVKDEFGIDNKVQELIKEDLQSEEGLVKNSNGKVNQKYYEGLVYDMYNNSSLSRIEERTLAKIEEMKRKEAEKSDEER